MYVLKCTTKLHATYDNNADILYDTNLLPCQFSYHNLTKVNVWEISSLNFTLSCKLALLQCKGPCSSLVYFDYVLRVGRPRVLKYS